MSKTINQTRKAHREGGFILVMVLSLVVVVLILASGMALMAQSALMVGGNVSAHGRATQAASAAAESALAVLKTWAREEDVQDGVQVSAPPDPEARGTAVLHLLGASPDGLLVRIDGSGKAPRGASVKATLLVKGKYQADPELFAGVVSMGQVTHQGQLQLDNGARVGSSGQLPLANGVGSTQVPVPVPQVAEQIQQAQKPCDVQLGTLVIDSQLQAGVLFQKGKTICVAGDVTFHQPLFLQGVRLQVKGQVLGPAAVHFQGAVLLAEGISLRCLQLTDSTLMAAGDVWLDMASGPAGQVSVLSGGQAQVQVRGGSGTGSLALVAGQGAKVEALSTLRGLVWSGGAVHWSGRELHGAIAATGPIDLGSDPHIIRDPALGREFIPGKLVYEVISRK